VHPNVLRAWRDQAIKELPTVFEQRDSLADAQAAHTKQLEELYAGDRYVVSLRGINRY
jgi:hypothetical protein